MLSAMKFQIILWGMAQLLKFARWRYPAFRARLKERSLIAQVKARDEDIGRYNTPIIRDPQDLPGAADFVITESTYGNKTHGPMSAVEPALLETVQMCITKRSRMLVPSFAVGRTQTILWYIQKFIAEKKIPQIPLYVDSPMGVEVSKVHTEFPEHYDQQTADMLGKSDLFGLAKVTFASSLLTARRENAERFSAIRSR